MSTHDDNQAPIHVVVMGVAGCGKSTVARGISKATGWPFAEGDSYHPAANVEKMVDGVPLTDEDRLPWLRTLADWICEHDQQGQSSVLSCSALRRSYRDVLREGADDVRFVHMAGSDEILTERVTGRRGHFFPPDLLASQLAILQPLEPDEVGITVDVGLGRQQQVDVVVQWLREDRGPTQSAES